MYVISDMSRHGKVFHKVHHLPYGAESACKVAFPLESIGSCKGRVKIVTRR